ncbi:MAG: YfhO family protein [Prevotella sp.]|nr:YfhO family protein [Prevotella sp.]
MEKLKKFLPDLIVIVAFIAISFAYFAPAVFERKVLYQHDTAAGRGAGEEAREYYQQTGERTRWTNSTFGGMPTYQTAPSYDSTDFLTFAAKAYHLWLPDNVWYVFVYLLGFYILLRAFNFREYLAALGAIIWAFSSYFFIIIAAGHIWKVWALAYLPPLIGGLVLAYRGKYLWGFIITAIFTAFEVNANHVQMTYYYLFIIFFMVLAFFIEAIKEHRLDRFLKATAISVVAAAIGICINISNLYHTWEYQKESMRGKSELVKEDNANQTDSGLERDYITQWSYGIGETWTLLVPNVKGGASVPISMNERAMKKADPQFYEYYSGVGQYWGDQPGTSGPVYVGAFVLMLFVLGLFVVKGPMKWALLVVTILSILLSWGKNFMGFTDFFIDHFPMYSKFRTVASILVIAEFTIPLLAVMALKKVIDEPRVLLDKMKIGGVTLPVNPLVSSFTLTGVVALLFAVIPNVFFGGNYLSAQEMEFLQQDPQNPILADISNVRRYILTSDAWRSFIIILLGAAMLVLFVTKKIKAIYMVLGISVLCLVDMWMVNKRYLNDGMFQPATVKELPQPKTPTDEMILQDKSLDYRVLNMASNTFNENETSFYHKSIGGYHAAKLRRYQELIDAYILPEMQQLLPAISNAMGNMEEVKGDSIYPVLNMLNTKYFILGLQDGSTMPMENPYTMGNAWYVDNVSYAKNANEELDGIGIIDLRHQAVADQSFLNVLGESMPQDSTAMVKITSYKPNNLVYTAESAKGGVVVFSEIYYPGWKATVDGKPAELGRVNYVLRALKVEPGKHEIVLDFHPASLKTTESVAYVAGGLLLLVIVGGVVAAVLRKRKEVDK